MTDENNTKLVTTKDKANNLKDMLEQYKPHMAAALPRHITPERMMRVGMNALTKRPKLLNCTPSSFILAMLECATLGLEPEVAGQCWILPYGDQATFIPGYKGLIQLCWRSGQLANLSADVVYERDTFDYMKFPPKMSHIPCREKERGGLVAAWAYAKLVGGGEQWVVLERHEVEAIKRRSPAKNMRRSPWNTEDEHWMWRKTALRQLLKFLPMSVEVQRVIDNDERVDAGLPQNIVVPDGLEDLDPTKEVTEDGHEQSEAAADLDAAAKGVAAGDKDGKLI